MTLGQGEWLSRPPLHSKEATMIIDKEDIFAVQIDDRVYHFECCKEDIEEDDIVHRDEADESKVYFCAECGKRIS